ncbi:MAG: amino acid ABC transporter permease [Pseudomonadota bacterium]
MELRFFEIYRSAEYLGLLAQGLAISAAITIAGAVLGFSLAIVLAVTRHEKVPVLRWISAAYVDFVRNTPLVVQVFFVAFGLPQLLGYVWPFWAHAVLALSLNFSAYFAEILRAGFIAADSGQREAAETLGLSRVAVVRKVMIPQAIASTAPSLNAQFVFLFLTTGIISEISVKDLTYAGLFIDSRSFRTFEVFITLTGLYILLALVFKAALTWAEHRQFRWKFLR